MKRILINVLTILLVLALGLGIFVVGRQALDYKKGQQDYSEAEQLANISKKEEVIAPSLETILAKPAEEDPYAVMLKEEIDLPALKEVNDDVLGWIEIPDTELSYPLLQDDNNDYYLNHTWKNEENSVGSVYLECEVAGDLSDFNTIVYGHRMRNLSMFGSLKFYSDIDYWREHPSVYVVIDGEAYRYDIYAAYKAAPDDIIYGLKIKSRPKKQEVIDFGLSHSEIDTGVIPTTYDRILTLSTCTGNGHAKRWIVQAVHRVEHSDLPEGAGSVFEGTDDSLDASQNSGDSLTFSGETGNQNRWSLDLPQVLLLAGLAVLVVVLIVAIIILVRRPDDDDEDDDDEDESDADTNGDSDSKE